MTTIEATHASADKAINQAPEFPEGPNSAPPPTLCAPHWATCGVNSTRRRRAPGDADTHAILDRTLPA